MTQIVTITLTCKYNTVEATTIIHHAGNNLTGIASHFVIQFLLGAKQLQNIIAENCDAIYQAYAECKCYAKMYKRRHPIKKASVDLQSAAHATYVASVHSHMTPIATSKSDNT